jgi:DNA-directed RNA polymerase subunit L
MMEIKIIEEAKKKVIFEIRGESHTLCNALKEELRNDTHVTVASYFVSHPDIDEPTFTIETDGASPKKALMDAVKRIKKENDKFLKVFQKEIK